MSHVTKLSDLANLPQHERANALNQYLSSLPKTDRQMTFEFVLNIYESWKDAPPEWFFSLLHDFLPPLDPPKEIKTIGILARAFCRLGGVERVLSMQIPMFHQMGLNIVLFNDLPFEPDRTFPIPEYVDVMVLPATDDHQERGEFLINTIKEKQIDLILYPWISTTNFLFDLLICRGICNIPFITHYHHTRCLALRNGSQEIYPSQMSITALADLQIGLSRVDSILLETYGGKEIYLPNPISFPLHEKSIAEKNSTHRKILWLGRVAPAKQPLEAVKIMSHIVKTLPDAQLIVVGGGNLNAELQKAVSDAGLQNNIVLTGKQLDVEKYYHDADLFLSTSEIEGFPMTFGEALSASLPVVAYDMAYLEFFRDTDSGIVSVPPKDAVSAAAECVKVLTDNQLYSRLSDNALRQAKKYNDFDFINAWEQIFTAIKENNLASLKTDFTSDDLHILIKTIFRYSIAGKWNLVERIEQRHKEKQALETKKFNEALKTVENQNIDLSEKLAKRHARCVELRDKLLAEQAQHRQLKALQSKTDKELDRTNKELDRANKKLDRTNKELDRTNKVLDRTNKELDRTNKKLDRTNKELGKTKEELAAVTTAQENFSRACRQQNLIKRALRCYLDNGLRYTLRRIFTGKQK